MRKELESRWLSEFDKYGVVKVSKSHFTAALDIADNISAKRAEVGADKRLSDVGRAEKVSELAATLAPAMAKARNALSAAKGALQKQKVELAPTVKDKSDVSRALLRQEAREFARTMRPTELAAYASSKDVDPVVLEAIFEAPSLVPGLNKEVLQNVLDAYLDRHAGPQLAAIAEQNDAIELLETAVRVAEGALRTAAGVPPANFGKWLAEKAPADVDGAEKQAAEMNAAAVSQSALSLPFEARRNLIDRLLDTQVNDLRA